MCLLSHALVILVTYRGKGLPQLPKPGDFMERKGERKREKEEEEKMNYLGTCTEDQNHVWKVGKVGGECGFLDKNLVDLEQGGPQ